MIPKFRAYHKKSKKMLKVFAIDFSYESVEIEVPNAEEYIPTDMIQLDVAVEEDLSKVELMQSTGLKDKNGKEIFDGDLVKYKALDQNTYTCKVRFNDYKLQWELYNIHPTDLECSTNKNNFSRCEIIGNLFENPELMEVGE